MEQEIKNAIADLAALVELTIKMLLEVGPNAVASPTLVEGRSDIGEKYIAQIEAVKRLGGFQALQDGLNLCVDIKRRFRT